MIFVVCSLFSGLPLIAFGAAQRKKTAPVRFWSGGGAPAAERVTDIAAYNHAHGNMWIFYGAGLLAVAVFSLLCDRAVYSGILFFAEIFGGLFAMTLRHRQVEQKYVKKEPVL